MLARSSGEHPAREADGRSRGLQAAADVPRRHPHTLCVGRDAVCASVHARRRGTGEGERPASTCTPAGARGGWARGGCAAVVYWCSVLGGVKEEGGRLQGPLSGLIRKIFFNFFISRHLKLCRRSPRRL